MVFNQCINAILITISLSTLTIQKIIASKGELRHLTSNKEFVGRLSEDEFEVVHPFQIRDKNDRIGIDTRNYFLNGTVHFKQVTIVIRSTFIGRLKLLLGLNELLFVNGTDFKKLDNGGELPFVKRIENCYYQGTVNGEETSFVALSTCNGLRGVIAFDNGSAFGIWPLDGGDRGRRHPHVLYRIRWSRSAVCGSQSSQSSNRNQRSSNKRDVTRQTKYVELAVIADNSFMKTHDSSEEEATAFILEALNIADYIFSRDLNTRLSVVYMENWIDAALTDYHDDIERTLSNAVQYVTGHIYHIAKDASLMFTTKKFVNDEVTSSTLGSICTARATGIVAAVDVYTVHDTAQIVSHNLAHILGLNDDSLDCTCNIGKGCIMFKQLGLIGSPFLWQFSKCSIARLHSVLQSGHLQCLLNKPLQASTLQQCGNGIVDGEEECDCGPRDKCYDPCCDPLTCTLRAHAQCAAHHTCCHRCQLLPSGHICRESRSVCDVEEVCSGESADCPPDSYFTDGTVCGISGQCWKGNCSDAEQQCKNFWGIEATIADVHCYERNELGVEYGNCGRDRDGLMKKCESENIYCGTLHCRDGAQTPIDLSYNSFNLQFMHEGKQVQCKMVADFESGIVMDGSSCGTGKVCVQGICSPLVQVSPPVHCPSNNLAFQCSGHGDCTTAQRCVCYDGWSGTACDTRTSNKTTTTISTIAANNMMIPSLAAGHTLDTTTLLAILLIVGLALLMLLVCLLFCYRRRSDLEFPIPADEKLNESIPENTNRSIKFGNMPSYREEKRKRKKDKHVYDALQRINEASDERDTTSLRSRDSETAAQAMETNMVSSPSYRQQAVVDYNMISPYNDAVDYSQREHLVSTIVNGSATSVLKRNGYVNRKMFPDGEFLISSPCSEKVSSPSSVRCCSVTMNPHRYERNRNGYATDSELGVNRYNPRYVEAFSAASIDLSPTSSQTSVQGLTPTPLKLNNIGMLLRQLQYSDDVTSEAELSGAEVERLANIEMVSNSETNKCYDQHETTVDSTTSDCDDGKCHLHGENERRSLLGIKQQPMVVHYRSSSNCFLNGSVSSERADLPDNLHQTEKEMASTNQSEKSVQNSHEQSQNSLFNDTFRLDV